MRKYIALEDIDKMTVGEIALLLKDWRLQENDKKRQVLVDGPERYKHNCFWHEGGLCYLEPYKRDDNGRSNISCKGRCEAFRY